MITCYLDSQDYSVLTDPKSATPARNGVREQLLGLARSKEVQFVYSSAIISEAAPLAEGAVRLAELRGDLVGELCGSNALMPLDRLLAREGRALRLRASPSQTALDPDGKWWPQISFGSLNLWDDLESMLKAMPELASLPRQQRHAIVRKLVKNGKPTSELRAHFAQQNPAPLIESLLAKMPLTPEYADMLWQYVLGRTTEKEMADALEDSLRVPGHVMRWFATNYGLAIPMANLIRAPGREMASLLRKFVDHSKDYATKLRQYDDNVDPISRGGEIAQTWTRMQNDQLVALMERVLRRDHPRFSDSITSADVDRFCPGISVAIRSLFASSWASVGGGRKDPPSDSQPVDALHSCYAPYVNVFRADRFMAEFIKREVKRHGTTVVNDLMNLPQALRMLLDSS